MSRQRSGRGASSASARPTGRAAGGRPGVFVQTPRSDIYVVMLSIALGAMVLGCLLLVILMGRYEWKVKAASLPGRHAATQLATASMDSTPAAALAAVSA